MMSVPPRLGKCKGCRERNIECDKKRPRCTQCMAADTACGGYDMGSIFINVTATGPPPRWQSQNDQKYLVLDLASQPTTAHHSHDLDLAANYATYGADSTATMYSTHSHTNLSQPDPEKLTAMTQLFVELFYGQHNPNKSYPCPFQEGTEVGCWRSLLPLWLGLSPILDAAIGALVTCFVGTQYRDVNLIDESRDLYLKALRLVQEVSPEPNASLRKDLLATSLVMSSTELFMSNGGGPSQLIHIEGAAKLLRERLAKPPFEELHIYLLNQGVSQLMLIIPERWLC
ncbi:hypothetical protein BCR34DRAFT_389004 [Clohesyomyces aquaticus]|uniref:Zn(2)-C6 fungal-type domain-containing protein n=1 Tax=Clohesyomyces aquaticus TaxID=1231657 RepID=A0A1Y1ZF48_9PLEO|nr:hypothetical protein BCR34DRAFT_389004 [Clohesyomyces aquaticus]